MYLAIDTSTRKALIALMDEDEFIVRSFEHHATQKVIFSELANILDPETLGNLDGIVVGIGPGSFTGLKIGVIAAKTLAWSRGLPLVGISSLDAVAAGIKIPKNSQTVLVIAVRSTKGEVYLRTYSIEENTWIPDGPIHDVPLDSGSLLQILPDSLLLVSGEAAESLTGILKGHREMVLVEEGKRYPMADGFYKLSRPRFESGDLDDPRELVPEYVRLSQPERLLKNKSK